MRAIIFTTHGAIDEKKIRPWRVGLGWILAVLGLTWLIGLLLGVELLFASMTLIFFTSSAPRLQ